MRQTSKYKTVDELPDLLNKAKQPEYKSVDELPDLKKKEPSDNGLKEPLDGGLDGTTPKTEPIPTVEMYNTPSGDLIEDPFTQVKKAKELSAKTKVVSIGNVGGAAMGTTGSQTVPDEEAVKEAKSIQEELKGKGFKEDFIAGISDMPEDAYNNPTTSKETLSVLYKNNPVKFTQLTNEAKNKYAIRDAAAKKAYDEAQGDDKQKSDYASKVGILKGNEYSGDEIPPPENMQQFYDIVRQKQELINQSIDNPEEKKKAQERLRQTYAQAINPTSLDFREEYQNSGYADKMDVNQYAGLKTLELFEPEKAKALRSVIDAQITPQWNVNVQVTPEEQVRGIVTDSAMAEKMGGTISQLTVNQRIGKEEALRELSLLGATNEYDSIVSEQNDLKNKYKEAQTDEEKANIYAKMLLNEQRANDLQKTEAQNDERYPITAKLKMDNLVKEVVQDRGIGVGGWMYNKYAHGVGSGVDAVENLVTSIFGSERDKTELRMKRIGEGKQFEASIYLPESERSINSPVIIQASDELKKKAKEILNGRSLSELSADEKDKLSQLVASNQDQIKTITNPEAGKSKNFWSKATGMTIAGFTADMGSFLTKMGLMQGVGMGAKAAEATTLFMDGYEPAFNKKLSEGASVESANEYGILHGAILSLMSKFGSKYETIMNVVKGGKSPISKYIAGLSEESWNKLAGESKPFLNKLGKATKDISKEQAKMIGTFGIVAPTASSIADNLNYDENKSIKEMADEAFVSAKEMAIGGIGFGIFGLARGVMKTKATPVEKAALFEMADFPELGKMRIDEAVKAREISKEEGERKKAIIDNVSKLVEQVPDTNDKGKPLTDQQRANYLFNLAVKESQKEKSKTLPEKQAEEAKQKALVADKENQIELEALTEKQLNDRKDKLEKAISKLDEKGKPELSDKEMADAKAELEAVNNIIKSKGDTTKTEEKLPKLSEPIEGVDEFGVPIGENVPAETKPLTKEAEDLLASIGEGSKPTFITKNLERIAKENGIEVTDKMSADDVINALKEKQKQQSEQVGSVGGDVDWSKDIENVDLSKVDWKNPTVEESIAGHENHIENNVKKGQQSLLPAIRELAKKYNLTKEQYLNVLPSIRQVLSNKEPNINSIENIIAREGKNNVKAEQPTVSETPPALRDVESTAKALDEITESDFNKLTPKQKVQLYKENGITKEDGTPITEADIENNPLQYSYDFNARSESGKWNSANSELESLVQGNKKQFALYKLMVGDFDTFKEFVDFINSKNYGDKIEYTERMRRADETMTPEERKAAIDSYNKSSEQQSSDKAQVEKDILNEHGLEDGKEYSPTELIEQFPLKGVQKVIWDIIKGVVDKLGIKVKFSSGGITEGFDGSNNPLTGEILIRPSTIKNGRIGEVLTHEVVHALTTKIISRVNSGVETGLSKTQVAAVKGLNKLYEAVRSDNKLQNKYPVKDIFEFIAHLTNEDFVKELETKDRNFLQKVVDFIADILGLSNANELAKKHLKDIISDGTFLEKEGITVVSSDYSANIQGAEGLSPKQKLLEALKNENIEKADAYHKALKYKNNPELVKAVESLLSKEQTLQVEKVGSGVGGDVVYTPDVKQGEAGHGTVFSPAKKKGMTLNEKQQQLINELPKKKVNYKELKGIGDLSVYLNNPDALNSPHLKSAKKIYEDIKAGKPIRDTPSVNETMDVMDGQNRIAAQLAAGITDIDVAVIDKSFYDKQNQSQPTKEVQPTVLGKEVGRGGDVEKINKTDFDENGDLTDNGFSKATNILSGIINDVADKYNIPKDLLLEHYNIKNGKYRSSSKGILDMGESQDYQKTIKLVKDIAFEMFPDKVDELNNQINSHSDELLNSLENGKPFEVNKSIGKVISALNEIDANWNKSKEVKAEQPTVLGKEVGMVVGGDVVDNKTKQQLLDERLNKIKEIKDKAEGTREERTKRYKELVSELGDETAALKKLQEEINARAKKEIDKLPELPKTENEVINEKGETDFENIKKDLGFKPNDYKWGKSPMDEDMGDMLLSKDKEAVIFIKPNEVEVYDEKNDQTDTVNNGVKIELVSTREGSRGKGKAKEMIQKVTDWADKNGTDLYLDIAPQDKSTTESGLKNLYESFGFEFDGIHGKRKPQSLPTQEAKAEQPTVSDNPALRDVGGQDLSGIRKALVSDKIIEGVDLERVSDKEMMSMGRKILDTGEIKPEALVEKIITDGKGVLTPTEVVGLITYKRDIDNALQDTYTKIAEKKAKGEDIGTLGVEAKNLERQIHDFDVMAVITAQQQSMAFRLRQRMLDREYNVVTQIEKYKANNNGEIPADVEAKFRELDKQLKDVKDKLIDAEKRLSEKEGQDAVNNIKESVEREKTYTEEELDKKINEGVEKEIAKLYEELPSDKKSAADKAIKALEKFREKIKGRTYESTLGIPMAIADLGAATAIRAIKVGKTVAEAVEIGINRIKKALKEKGIDTWEKESEYRKDLTTTLEEEGVSTKKKPKDKPVINEDGTVSIPNEMLRDLVKRGITDINDLTKAVHDQVKKDLPDISERQVRDYITDYGKKVNPTADEIQTQVNTAKRVGRLLSELEDLEKLSAIAFGVKYKKVKPTGSKLIEYERELKRKINTLSKDVFEKVEKTDEQKLADAKRRVKDRIDELNRKIKNKDFAKPAKKLQPTDNELVELNAEKERLQEEFDKEQYALELKNRNVWQKWEDRAYEATSGLMRGLTLGVDLSAAGVQGMRRLFTNPKESAIAFWDGLKFLVSEKGANAYMDKQKAQPYYPLLRATKLAIDDKSGKQSVKEGMFVSEWINFIWNKAIAPVAGLGTNWGTNFVRKINPYAASQRAYDGYVNSIRIQTFLKLAKELTDKDGLTYESHPKEFEKLADFVNTTTGRGSLGAADANSRWLNVFLTAPRKVISEVKLYTPYAFVYYARMPKVVRMKALKDFAQFTGTFLAVNALMWAARKNWDNDEDDDNFWNMNSSDFLTHKFGDKRVSIGGGMKSILTMQARFLTGKYTDQYGVTTKLGDRYGKPINTRLDLVTRFAIGKAAPVFNVLAKKLDERAGRPVENEELIKNISVPLWIQDVGDLYKNDPNSVAPLLMTLSILGANVRTVDKSKSQLQSEELSKEPIFKEYIDKGVNFPELNPEKIQTKEVNGKVIEKLSDYDTKIQEDFIKKKKEYLKQEFLKLKNGTIKVYVDNDGNATTTPSRTNKLKSFNQLNKEQIQNVVSNSISKSVTEKVKKEILENKKPKK